MEALLAFLSFSLINHFLFMEMEEVKIHDYCNGHSCREQSLREESRHTMFFSQHARLDWQLEKGRRHVTLN